MAQELHNPLLNLFIIRRKDILPAKRNRDFYGLRKMSEMMNEFENSLDGFFHGFGFSDFPSLQDVGFIPKLDVKEEKDKYLVVADIPGMDKNNINISIEDDTLIISGEKGTETTEENKDGYVVSERSFGKFQRQIRLGENIKTGEISAEYRDGVLNITVPKNEEKIEKKIPLKIEIK